MYCKNDFKIIQNIYLQDSNDIVVLYGNSNSGILDLLKDLIKDKLYFYYKASCVENITQESLFSNEIINQSKRPKPIVNDFDEALKAYLADDFSDKKIIIFDDFTNLLKKNSTFVNYISSLITSDSSEKSNCLVVLCTQDVRWVKEDMIKCLGKIVYELSAVIETGNLSIDECESFGYENTKDDHELFYYCIGGNPTLWKRASKYNGFKDFITNHYLDTDSYTFKAGLDILPKDLRNLSIYNTLLYYLTNYNKLNEIHKITNIERAKLIVYLKTLISYGIVEKDINNNGKYYIIDPFVRFWFYFIFPNISSVYIMPPERFYKKIMEPNLEKYYSYYIDVNKTLKK